MYIDFMNDIRDSHNIVKIYNNVMWDLQYSMEYSWIFSTFINDYRELR